MKARPARKPPRTRTRLDLDARRAQLLALGLDVFATRSYDDVPIEEIARAAGISKGLLFHYFPTKRHFYVATIREAARTLLAETAMAEIEDPIARLYAGLDAYFSYVDRHGPAYAALLRGGIGSDPEVAAVVEETRGKFLERLMAGLHAQPVPRVRLALRAWLGFVEAAALDWLERRDVPVSDVRDLVVQVLTAITGAVTGPAPTPTGTPRNPSRPRAKT